MLVVVTALVAALGGSAVAEVASTSLHFCEELGPGTHAVAARYLGAVGEVEVEEANLSVWAVGS